MGVFDDKRYEELDWISKAVEPIEASITKVLESMPERLEVDFELYKECMNSWRMELRLDALVAHAAAKLGHDLSYEDLNLICKCYAIQHSERPIVNFETQTIDGVIALVRIRSTFEESELKNLLGSKATGAIGELTYWGNLDLGRLNEVMEMLGNCEDGIRSRSVRNKVSVLRKQFDKIMSENLWNLRNVELSNKIGTWIIDYIKTGNLASFNNFCRLKVMTHKAMPIYSIEEVE